MRDGEREGRRGGGGGGGDDIVVLISWRTLPGFTGQRIPWVKNPRKPKDNTWSKYAVRASMIEAESPPCPTALHPDPAGPHIFYHTPHATDQELPYIPYFPYSKVSAYLHISTYLPYINNRPSPLRDTPSHPFAYRAIPTPHPIFSPSQTASSCNSTPPQLSHRPHPARPDLLCCDPLSLLPPLPSPLLESRALLSACVYTCQRPTAASPPSLSMAI